MIEWRERIPYRLPLILLCIALFLCVNQAPTLGFQRRVDGDNNLRLYNEFIAIIVNQGPEDMGRFAVETTGGDPGREEDKNQPLIYGRPRPWPSYTTIRIDGENYAFGGPTDRRAGRAASFGELIEAPRITQDGELVTIFSFEESIEVRQVLSLIESSTTGLPDTAQIKYEIKNKGQSERELGLRIMLDTMLGVNDGAPFRIGAQEILTDYMLEEDLPIFWQAFDSLSNPRVIAQGTLKGPMFTPPDRIYFSNWGSLADGVWHFNFQPGREFLREGEFELDSAMALYWDPVLLEPGQSLTYVTGYGLGGITLVPGLLSLGLTSPAEAEIERAFPVIAYVENTAGMTAEDVEVEINLPNHLRLAPMESSVKRLGDLDAGETSQILWQVIASSRASGQTLSFSVEARARNTDSNLVQRRVTIQEPAEIAVLLPELVELGIEEDRLNPNPFFLEGTIKNVGGTTAYDLTTWIDFVPGLNLATMERREKTIGSLYSGEEVQVFWLMHALGVDGLLPYVIAASATNTEEVTELGKVRIPELDNRLYFSPLEEVEEGDILIVPLIISSTERLSQIYLDIEYDPEILSLLRISRGPFFMEGGKRFTWDRGEISHLGVILGLGGEPAPKLGPEILTELHFEVLDYGSTEINIIDVSAETEEGESLDLGIANLELEISPYEGGEE